MLQGTVTFGSRPGRRARGRPPVPALQFWRRRRRDGPRERWQGLDAAALPKMLQRAAAGRGGGGGRAHGVPRLRRRLPAGGRRQGRPRRGGALRRLRRRAALGQDAEPEVPAAAPKSPFLPPSRNIHVPATASPRPASTGYPRRYVLGCQDKACGAAVWFPTCVASASVVEASSCDRCSRPGAPVRKIALQIPRAKVPPGTPAERNHSTSSLHGGRGVAATRVHVRVTRQPRRRRESSPRPHHVKAAASPRLASTSASRESRGVAATCLHTGTDLTPTVCVLCCRGPLVELGLDRSKLRGGGGGGRGGGGRGRGLGRGGAQNGRGGGPQQNKRPRNN